MCIKTKCDILTRQGLLQTTIIACGLHLYGLDQGINKVLCDPRFSSRQIIYFVHWPNIYVTEALRKEQPTEAYAYKYILSSIILRDVRFQRTHTRARRQSILKWDVIVTLVLVMTNNLRSQNLVLPRKSIINFFLVVNINYLTLTLAHMLGYTFAIDQ